MASFSTARIDALLGRLGSARIAVVGDVMLDQFIWGQVQRISPEAPVPVLEFGTESWMSGGAANVARNLTALGVATDIFGGVGRDDAAPRLRAQLRSEHVHCDGLLTLADRPTSTKVRLIAGHQQIVRLDREVSRDVPPGVTRRILRRLDAAGVAWDGLIIADYGKGMVTQELVDGLRARCHAAGCWLSVDPKPVHALDLRGVSLLTPNRKEAFALAGIADRDRASNPLEDASLMAVVDRLHAELSPVILLITLGELGLLLCPRNAPPHHIPTVARQVFDVSGAGDTVIAMYTAAICAGASPVEAAILANHAAGVVVGKRGTATVSAAELKASLQASPRA